MTDKYFCDSNIWLYMLLEKGSKKSIIAQNHIETCGLRNQVVISWQVINEVNANLLKNGFSEQQILDNIKWMLEISTIQDFTEEIVLNASSLRKKYSISYWDSLIIASALESNCSFLISEDMQDGQKISNLTIRNIFSNGNP